MLRTITPNLFDPPLTTRPRADLHAAFAGAIASIPQTLAYGLIVGSALGGDYSGLGILAALYGSAIVGLFAVLFGGSAFLVAGPRASTLLVFSALIVQLKQAPPLTALPDPTFIALGLACVAAATAGLLQWLFGMLRFGRLTHYIPLPVVAGFINGSAILIILSQIWTALGIPRQASLLDLPAHLGEIRPGTLLLCAATVCLVFALRRRLKSGSAVLWAVLASNLVYLAGDALGFGSALGGTLPALPSGSDYGFLPSDALALLGSPQGRDLLRLMAPAAISMAILSSLDTLLACAAVDEITLRQSNAGRQLAAEGAGNFVAGLLSAIPGSSSMVRTQAAMNGGMVSAATPIGIAAIVLITATLLGSALPLISQAVMAGLLIALGIDLFDKWTLARLRGVLENAGAPLVAIGDILTMLVVVTVTVVADLATAVGVGMLVALLSFVLQMVRSPIRRRYRATALLPRIHGDLARRRFIETHGRRIAILEMEGALFFGSSAELKKAVDELVDEGVLHVALDMKRVTDIDATGARALERLNHKLTVSGGMLALGYVQRERRFQRLNVFGWPKDGHRFASRRMWLKLGYLGALRSIGEGRFFADIDAAVAACEAHLAESGGGAAPLARWPIPPILRGMSRATLRRLLPQLDRLCFAEGETIFAQGDVPHAAFLLVSGRVDVLLDLPGTDRKLKVQSLGAGAVFGEMALIDPQARSATVIAREPTCCYALSTTTMALLKRTQSDIAFALLENVAVIFAERLRATNNMLSEMDA